MLQENNPCEFIHQTFIDEGAELMQVMNNMIHIGHEGPHIVVALERFGLKASLPGDVGAFMTRDEALNFLGRFTQELKARGWLD